MRKFFGLTVVLIIAGAAIWLLGNNKPAGEENLDNQESQTNQGGQEGVLVSTSTISQTDSFYNIKADWPQFTKVEAVFNEKISGFIEEKVDAFKKDAKDSWDARNATLLPGEELSANPQEPFDFIADWKARQVNDKYVSFVMTMYYFTGGAHGINEVSAFNYDVASKKEITTSGFFNSSEENLQKLSDLAIREVVSHLENNAGSVDESMKAWVEEGAGPDWENFKNFNFDNSSMVIYFQQYQVAAGAFGPITITLFKDALEQNSITSNYLQ
ncbi:MAG: DUF3298 and DUF4163 domain-containing protein [Parcubacteria group bacterium]